MNGIACRSAASCFAVGTDSRTHFVLAEHWNGRKWRVQRSPSLPDIGGGRAAAAELSGVSCSGADCMATGSFSGQFETPESTPTRSLGELWNGKKWTVVKTPSGGAGDEGSGDGSAVLNAVSCGSATRCAAAGIWTDDNEAGPVVLLVATWNGSKWREGKIADPSGGNGSWLYGVACTTACTAVGSYDNSSAAGVSLAERN